MTDSEIPISEMRSRLNDLLADWGADLSSLLAELEEKRARVDELEAAAEERSEKLDALARRVEAQDELIESLQGDATEAGTLRKELVEKDFELERKDAEIDSKQELIRALRRDAEKVGRLTGDGRAKDKEIERLVREKDFAEKHAADVTEEFKVLAATTLTNIDAETELKVLRAELDARKSLVNSLRGDAERTKQLETQLDEKRAVIEQLESSVDQHVKSLAEMQEVIGKWKSAASALGTNEQAGSGTTSGLSQLTDDELASLRSLEDVDVELGDAATDEETSETLAETRRVPTPKITTNG
ncbi:MAG: hypothetical protein ACR2QQ_02810 [Gammaproteobacteria bacterium]